LAGICAAPEAGNAGVEATVAGVAMAAFSSTLPDVLAARGVPTYANNSVLIKKTVANTAVVRDKKLALPLAPKRLPDPPLPNAAPMSAPFPCWTRINPTMATAEIIWTANKIVNKTFINNSKLKHVHRLDD
jgi:hypothetical protein